MKVFLLERDLKKHVKAHTLLFKCSATWDLSPIRKAFEGVEAVCATEQMDGVDDKSRDIGIQTFPFLADFLGYYVEDIDWNAFCLYPPQKVFIVKFLIKTLWL